MKTIGRWIVRLDNLTIEHVGEGYWIDLERCCSPSQVLDWIMQVANKSWADDETLASLVRAWTTLCGRKRPCAALAGSMS